MEVTDMKESIMKRLTWGAGASAVLSLFYVLSRPDVLGGWHNMNDWPLYLYALGLIAIVIAALTYSRRVMICVPIGYMIGFLAAWLFNTDSFDPGGGLLNNGWIIWTISLLALLLTGIVWEIIMRRIIKKAG